MEIRVNEAAPINVVLLATATQVNAAGLTNVALPAMETQASEADLMIAEM